MREKEIILYIIKLESQKSFYKHKSTAKFFEKCTYIVSTPTKSQTVSTDLNSSFN